MCNKKEADDWFSEEEELTLESLLKRLKELENRVDDLEGFSQENCDSIEREAARIDQLEIEVEDL